MKMIDEKLENGIKSRFWFDGDMELVKNVYEYFNIQDEYDNYKRWFERCIKKYNLVENEDYNTFKSIIDNFEELDYILMFSNKNVNLIDEERANNV